MKYYDEEPSRGRPRGHQSYSTTTVLRSIAHIAAKQNLDPGLLLDALTKAWIDDETRYEQLEVTCRKVDHGLATLLITCNDKVVCQFPISLEILEKPEHFKTLLPTLSTPVILHRDGSTETHICDLRAKMKDITVKARVVEVPTKRLVNTRYGWEAYVSNILLADTTGTVRLSLWNNQIDDVSVGDTVNIENASATWYRGELQLRIGRSGKISTDTFQPHAS